MANTTTKPDLPQVPDGKDDIAFQLAQAKAELEQKNKELQEYHDRLEASMMAGNLAWWQMDVRSGAVLFNEQKTRMLGYSAEEFKHYSDFTRLVHPEDEPLAMQAMRDYLSGKADRYFCEYRIRCADGAYKWFRDIGVASRKAPDGRPELLTGVVVNITEIKEAELAALKVSEEKSRFLANMSHEIRTPLSAVIGFVELLEQESLSEEATAWLKSTNSAAHILLDLISTILDFSKIEAGKMELDPRPIDVYELVTQVSDMLRPTAQRKGLQLIVDMLDTNDRIFVLDDVRLKQILINLSGNALKFCEKGAVTLLLRVREVENNPDCAELCFQVRDTGPGISPDQQKKLFKAFSQADASIARRYGGTGLGLALSTLLVHKMGGELELDSEVGKGSVFGFCITVPRGDASEVAASSSNQCNETNAFTQAFRDMTVCVLIAEDVEMNRFLLERSVQRLLPYATILLASNGQEAEALYKKHTPDIILLDIQMPEYDGIWAVERIRTQEAEQGKERVPIIGVSAGAQIEEKSAALAAGMDDYVVKPVETARLQEVFMRFINQVDRAEPENNNKQQIGTEDSFNPTALLARVQGDYQTYTQLLSLSQTELPLYFQRLQTALEAAQFAEAKSLAHAFKGSAATLCCYQLHNLLVTLEAELASVVSSGAAPDRIRIKELSDAVFQEMNSVLTQMQKILEA